MIVRQDVLDDINYGLSHYPVTLLLGPRQCGKTTVSKQLCLEQRGSYFDLEDPATPLIEDSARLLLQDLVGLVVIDEIQLQPSLFSLLRVLADRRPVQTKFLILGSASPYLVRGASESLAGRVHYVTMSGFNLSEASGSVQKLWMRGGFPDSYLSEYESDSFQWRLNYVRTFLERDVPQLGLSIPAPALRRFWTMLAHSHGQIWNASDLSRSLGVRDATVRRYLDILSGSFMVRQLQPWFVNVGKRLVKSPKIYMRDSGILHVLLGIVDFSVLQSHPKLGFSWEGFAIEQILSWTGAWEQAFFYQTHGGAELDLLLELGGKKYGFEFKYQDRPRSSKSMHQVMIDLELTHLWVVYPGEYIYSLTNDITVMPLSKLQSYLPK